MSRFVEIYKDLFHKYSDPRTSNWFLISGPGPLLLIIASYVYFCVSVGPKYMKDKKAYTLKNVLMLYNFLQVLASMYLVYEGLMAGWLNDYNFACQPIDKGVTGLRMAHAVYLYFLCKLVELLDTVFFVLRKKNRQISFLHLYHHALMPITAWIGVRFFPGGHVTLIGLINSFVHVFMYAYYMLSAMGPWVQKYLWWKRYLTVMQIVQFAILSVHNGQILFNGCEVLPKPLVFLFVMNAALFVYLFSSFYIATYVRKDHCRAASSVATVNGFDHVERVNGKCD